MRRPEYSTGAGSDLTPPPREVMPSIETPPPRLGQHTEEVLLGLGYTEQEIAALRAEGAI